MILNQHAGQTGYRLLVNVLHGCVSRSGVTTRLVSQC